MLKRSSNAAAEREMRPAEKLLPDAAERRTGARYQPEDAIGIDLVVEGRRLRAAVEDLSVRGMKLGLAGECRVGAPVQLEHRAAGSFRGVCIWNDREAIGVELVEPAREIERVLQCVCLLIGLRAPL